MNRKFGSLTIFAKNVFTALRSSPIAIGARAGGGVKGQI